MTSLLTAPEAHESRRLLQRSSVQRASDRELAAMAEEYDVERALLQGDLTAGDSSLFDEETLRNGIAFYEYHLGEIAKQAERRLCSRQFRMRSNTDQDEDFRARFDAMRVADIVDAIQTLGTPLRKRGREWWGLCPFHQERTPSFAVSMEKGVWRCHGCHRGGDLVSFVMEHRHVNAVEALRFLEEIINVRGITA
jgi:hypothetical protein